MSLDAKAGKLREELREALENSDDLLGDYEQDRLRVPGPFYRKSSAGMVDVDLENHAYEYLTMMLGKLASGIPVVRVGTVRPGPAQFKAQAQQYALNRWSRLTNLRRTLRRLATDLAQRFFVATVYPSRLQGVTEWDDPPNWPTLARIPPPWYTWDPLAMADEECRFKSHLTIRDKEDVLREAREHPERGWNVELIERMKTDVRREDGRGPRRSLERGEIEFWNIWVPEHTTNKSKAKKGHYGTWYTISPDHDEYVRKPYPYFGERGGPYIVRAAVPVQDEPVGASPLVATRAQAEELNAVAQTISNSIKNYKQVLISNDPQIVEALQNGLHQYFVHGDVEKLAEAVAAFEVGGVTQHLLAAKQMLQERRDRATGVYDNQVGNVVGVGTATEVQNAAMASENRHGDLVETFRDGLCEIYKKVAFYMEFDPQFRMRLGPEASLLFRDAQGNPIPYPEVQGSAPTLDDLRDFETNEYEIEAHSTERTGEAKRMALREELVFLGTQVGPLIPATAPWIKWKEWLRRWDDLSELKAAQAMFDVDAALEIAAQGAPPPEPIPLPQPRLSSDIGKPRPFTPSAGRPGSASGQQRGTTGQSRMLDRGNGSPKTPGLPK